MAEEVERPSDFHRKLAVIADFGRFALRNGNLMQVLVEAARACAFGLNVPFCKVCRFRPAENDLLIEAGYGWQAGVIGHVVSRADASSPQGRAFITGQPIICDDIRTARGFALPDFYAAHGVISTIDVVIKGSDRPYGVLEIDNDRQHAYGQYDIDFLTSFANILGEAVAAAERNAILQSTLDQMTGLVVEKDRLLRQKQVLAEELQHRVRNNLQLIYGILARQLENPVDQTTQRGLKAIALRVSTLAKIYDHLLGSDLTPTTDFGAYTHSLCLHLASILGPPGDAVSITCDAAPILLDLDAVTALGIIVTELVSNGYDHAFPSGRGTIEVAVRYDTENAGHATLTVRDNGAGFNGAEESKRHGIGLVRRLVEQVNGTATLSCDGGTVWTIRFPIPRSLDDTSGPRQAAPPPERHWIKRADQNGTALASGG